MKPIISIVGKKNSGKTTLIEKIIPELTKRGYKVGAIKHDVHEFEIDHEGKDTWRMTKAGADTVVIASDKKLAMIKMLGVDPLGSFHEAKASTSEGISIDQIAEWLFPDVDPVRNMPTIHERQEADTQVHRISNGVDIIITEGYKRENKPKIEVTQTGELLCSQDDNLIAVVFNPLLTTNNQSLITNLNVPCFNINETEKIVDLIEEKFLKRG